MGKRPRKKIEYRLPPIGTTLVAKYKKKPYHAKIVESSDFPGGKAVNFENVFFGSLTGAAKAVTKQSVNGWRFWKIKE